METSKRKYEIFNDEKLHEYTVTAEEKDRGTEFKMFRSEGTHWTQPGELLFSCLDKGDLELIFEQGIKKKINHVMDYSTMTELRVFLNTISQFDRNIGVYHMVEATNPTEV